MKLRLSIERNILLLFTCIYAGSIVCAQDTKEDKAFSYELLESNEYCWDGKNVKDKIVSNSKDLELSISTHEYSIIPFFRDFAKLMEDTIYDVSCLSEIEYCCRHYYIETCGKDKEESQRYGIDVNILSDIKSHSQISIDLNHIKSQDYVYINVISEAPIKAVIFKYFDELVLVYYNMFDDKQKVIEDTKQFLKSLNEMSKKVD